jgi:hypothetical protein
VSVPEDRGRTRKESDALLLALAIPCFVYFLIVYVLPPPLPIQPEAHLLESSWHIVLTDAFLRGAQFGRDIVYTYGPWGFVENPQGDPRIYPWLFGARLLIALAFVLGTSLIVVRRIAVRTTRSLVGRFLFIAWVALLSDPVYVLPMILLAVESFSDRERDRMLTPIAHLLAVACALTMWIKFTSFVTVGALAAALAVQNLMRRRRSVIPLEIFAAALAFWVLAGQSLFGLPSFLHGALSTALSYSAAMSLPGPYGELGVVAALMAAIAIPAAVLFHYRRPWSLWPSLCWIGLLFFLQLKEAFVRYDPFHVWMGIVNALLPCALLLICIAGFFDPESSYPPVFRVLTRVCAACVVLLSVVLTAMEIPTRAGLERYQMLGRNMNAVKALASGRSLSVDYRRQLEEFRRREPLRQVAGTADFFPDEPARLYGNSLRVRLPPIPQAFEAYNSYLSGLNASLFRGPSRPDFVFFDIAPIDARYPSAADPFSWLALMNCYLPAGNSGRFLVLRAAGCEDASLDLIAETRVRAGQSIAVPVGGDYPVWVEVDMRLNRRGSIVAALTSPPDMTLAVHTALGRRVFSLSAETGRTGFLLSPLLLDPASFGNLFVEGGIDPRTEVRDLSIVQSDRARRLYEPAIGLRLYKVVLRHRALAPNGEPVVINRKEAGYPPLRRLSASRGLKALQVTGTGTVARWASFN